MIPLCEMKIRIQPVEKDYIWPARLHRMQVTCLGNVLVDGAHNQDGLEYLGNYIANTNFNDIDFMIGVSEGRNPKLVYEMVKKTGLLKNVSRISLFNFENVPDMEWIKCTEIKVLLDQFQDFEGVKSYLHVSDFFLENEVERKDIEYVEGLYKCDKSRLTVVCGSLYFCSSFLRFIDYKIG